MMMMGMGGAVFPSNMTMLPTMHHQQPPSMTTSVAESANTAATGTPNLGHGNMHPTFAPSMPQPPPQQPLSMGGAATGTGTGTPIAAASAPPMNMPMSMGPPHWNATAVANGAPFAAQAMPGQTFPPVQQQAPNAAAARVPSMTNVEGGPPMMTNPPFTPEQMQHLLQQQQLAHLAEWKYLSLQAAEDQIVHVRREFLSKRQSAQHKKRQLDLKAAAATAAAAAAAAAASTAAATSKTKRAKAAEYSQTAPSTLLQMPAWRQYEHQGNSSSSGNGGSAGTMAAMTLEQHGEWLEQRRKAVAVVEVWMENFRQSHLRYWREHKRSLQEIESKRQSDTAKVLPPKPLQFRSELSPTSVFGGFSQPAAAAAVSVSSDASKIWSPSRCCQLCSCRDSKSDFYRDAWFPIKESPSGDSLEKDDLMQCLECSFTGCAPASVCSKPDETNQHILQHFLTSNHKYGVTCGPKAQVYCFPCGEFVRHEIFDQERHRIDVVETLPWMAWKEHPVQRSFEALQFLQVRDLGIFWRGMLATYPGFATSDHIKASRLSRERQIVCRGEVDQLPKHASQLAIEATVRQQLTLPGERWRIPAPVGMYNLGNTCFMTAILHCLVHCVPLQQYFLRDIGHNYMSCAIHRKNARGTAGAVCLACELDRLFLRYMDSAAGIELSSAVSSVSPQLLNDDVNVAFQARNDKALAHGEPLLTADMLTAAWKCGGMKHLAGYEQRDAHEFLHGFLDILGKHMRDFRMRVINSINGARATNTYLAADDKVQHDEIKRLFEGTLRSVLVCGECGSKRIQTEPFMSISLPLAKEVDKSRVSSRPSESLSVERCLQHFTQPEALSDPVDCPNCGKKTPTKKQHVVSKLPKILCLHLKRFDAAQNKKIEDFVSFPSKGLNMGRYLPHWCEVSRVPSARNEVVDDHTIPQIAYDLFATVNHFGNLQSGHYVANVKVKDMWYHCNDSHVVYAGVGNGEAEVLQSEGAYLVFYSRR